MYISVFSKIKYQLHNLCVIFSLRLIVRFIIHPCFVFGKVSDEFNNISPSATSVLVSNEELDRTCSAQALDKEYNYHFFRKT
jgi:hypothetical protein